jgi:hypothetical protein
LQHFDSQAKGVLDFRQVYNLFDTLRARADIETIFRELAAGSGEDTATETSASRNSLRTAANVSPQIPIETVEITVEQLKKFLNDVQKVCDDAFCFHSFVFCCVCTFVDLLILFIF